MKIESQYTIKNCPFCNSQGNLYKLGSRAYVVRCANPACKAEQIVFSCEEAAVQMWNKRPVVSERPNEIVEQTCRHERSE